MCGIRSLLCAIALIASCGGDGESKLASDGIPEAHTTASLTSFGITTVVTIRNERFEPRYFQWREPAWEPTSLVPGTAVPGVRPRTPSDAQLVSFREGPAWRFSRVEPDLSGETNYNVPPLAQAFPIMSQLSDGTFIAAGTVDISWAVEGATEKSRWGLPMSSARWAGRLAPAVDQTVHKTLISFGKLGGAMGVS